jgi:hypothetical protein
LIGHLRNTRNAGRFRTIEDASAVDLDWFWRGWFYTTDNVDQSIDQVKWFQIRKPETDPEKKTLSAKKGDLGTNTEKKFQDFNGGPEPLTLIPTDPRFNGEFRNMVDDNAIIEKLKDKNMYEVTLSNKGGLVMPVIIEWTFKDGSKQVDRIPAEIWRNNESKVTKVFIKDKEVVSVVLDPMKEITDVNTQDNVFPKSAAAPSKFDEFKKKK